MFRSEPTDLETNFAPVDDTMYGGEHYVMDAECITVCNCPNAQYAHLIADALNEYANLHYPAVNGIPAHPRPK